MPEASDLSFQEIFEGVVNEIESITGGITLSTQILDVKGSPQTVLNKLFSIDMQTRNTKKYRDRSGRRMRLENILVVRIAHRLIPDNQVVTQQEAWADESNAIIQLMTTTRKPLCYTRIQYSRTRRAINPQREWLYTDIELNVEFDLAIQVDEVVE